MNQLAQTTTQENSTVFTNSNLLWSDEFNGTEINRDYWNTDLGDGDTLVPGAKGSHLLNYNYLGYITDEDVEVSNGTLKLWNQKRSY